ncbi:MAG: AI-2E family transporter [Treponema sp.]|jgi:predicted PurR-regulated permease PerM|nr:AI-2E family transporter [Treponema sp.]
MSDSDPLLPSPIQPSPKTIQNIVFGALLIILFVLVCRLFAPFFTVLLWSILFYILAVPIYQKITKNMNFTTHGGKIVRNLLAAAFSLGTIIVILLPLAFVGFQFFRQIMELIRMARDFFIDKPGAVNDTLEYLSDLIGDLTSGMIVIRPDEIQRRIVLILSASLQNLLQISSTVARDVGSFLVGLVFMLFCLFFFYMDGAYLSRIVLHIIPIRKEYVTALVGKFKEITRNLFLGYIMVGLVQAVLAYIVFTIFQVRGALVFAGLVLICSFIPMFGAGLVWFPLGMVRVLGGNVVGGIVFLIVSSIVISTLDNFLRPLFLQHRIQLHPLFIFVSILGGVTVFGFNGLVLGPMLVILFLTVLDLFLTEHDINLD